MGWWSVRGSVTISRRGSLNCGARRVGGTRQGMGRGREGGGGGGQPGVSSADGVPRAKGRRRNSARSLPLSRVSCAACVVPCARSRCRASARPLPLPRAILRCGGGCGRPPGRSAARRRRGDQTHLLRDLVREGARRVAAGHGLRARVVGELEHGALRVGPRRDGDDVRRVLDGHDDARRELDLLPRLAGVEDVDAVQAPAPHVLVHLVVHVLRAKVRLRRDQAAHDLGLNEAGRGGGGGGGGSGT